MIPVAAPSTPPGATIASNPSAAPDRLREIAWLLLLATLWAASYSLIKIAVAEIPPFTLMAARTGIAAAVLSCVLRMRGLRLPRQASAWRALLVQALLATAIPHTLLAWGQQSVDASLAAILNSTSPVFAFLIGAVALRREAAVGRKGLGAALGLAGVLLVIGLEALATVGEALVPQLAILAATVAYAAAAVFGGRFAGQDPVVTATGALWCACAVLAPLALAIDRPWTLRPGAAPVAALLALAVMSTALAWVVYYRLLRTLGSVATTAQAYLRAPIAVLLAATLLGESLAPAAWAGLGLVAAGVALMTLAPRGGGRGA